MGASERATGRESLTDPSLVRFRAVIQSGLAALEERREEVNELDVFGRVGSDLGDTGDNMVLTLRAVVAELDRLAGATEGRTLDEVGRDEIVASVARAALLGARGNSGVILSQLIRGAAEELASRPGELIDPALIGSALARAVDQAYGSVRDPAEGTILTVAREMAHRVASELAHRPDARLAPETTALEQDIVIARLIQSVLATGEDAVARSPDRLRALRDAGVVDAGGYGLVVMVAGIVAGLRGGEPAAAAASARPAPEWSAPPGGPRHRSSSHRYCASFGVTGDGLDRRRQVAALEAIGDAVLVVGDRATLKVHLHTDDPVAATALFDGVGEVTHLEVVHMGTPGAGDRDRSAEAPRPVSGVVAIADGDGLRELFADLGATVVGVDADAEEIGRAVASVDADEVLVLPNAAALLDTAHAAVAAARRPAVVVATTTPQAGLAAAGALAPGTPAADNATAMAAAADRVRTGSVGPAVSDDPQGRWHTGDALGLVDDEPAAWGSPGDTLREVLTRLGSGAEIITALSGAAPPLDEDAVAVVARSAGDGVPLTQSRGGQPHVWWLLSAQ